MFVCVCVRARVFHLQCLRVSVEDRQRDGSTTSKAVVTDTPARSFPLCTLNLFLSKITAKDLSPD